MGAIQAAANKEQARHVRGRLAVGLSAVGTIAAVTGWILIVIGLQKVGTAVYMTGFGMVAGALTFLGAFEELALLRLIQDLPTSRIRSAHQGYVELQGFVRPSSEFLTCPACDMRCLWFQYFTGKNQNYRHTPKGRTPDIVLDDDTGLCVVQAADAELRGAGGSNGHIHIRAGDWIYVLGEFRSRSAVSPSATTETPEQKAALRERLQALKRDDRLMALFDRNKDGNVDSREWEAAVKATKLKMAREPAALPDASRPEHVLGKPTTDADRLPFVIFVGTEEEAVSRARTNLFLRLFMAFVIGTMLLLFALDQSVS